MILGEFVATTGMHRKAVIRLLNRGSSVEVSRRRGRQRQYGAGAAEALKVVWEACDRLCSKRLQPFIPEMLKVLREHGEHRPGAATEAQLCQMSASTIDRLLRPYRQLGGRRSFSTTKSGSLLKSSIPIRTFADWQEDKPGFMETDLVAHCGEFINQSFYNYCRQEKITFTRSRAYKKNDSCHVEQKNGNVVRRLVGYDRYTSKVAYECLGRVYNLVRLYINFFQPTMKLVDKTRNGAKVHKVYETAQTPYQRLLQSAVLSEGKRAELAATYRGLNPVLLLKQINGNLEQLWRLADRLPVR